MKSLIIAVAILLLVNSCSTAPTTRPESHQRLSEVDRQENQDPIFTTTVNASQAGGVDEEELKVGEGSFINEEAAKRRLSAVSADGEIVLNF